MRSMRRYIYSPYSSRFALPTYLESREPFSLKLCLGCWNLSLSIFSIIGLSRTAPALLTLIQEKGFTFSVCYGGEQPSWFDGPCGLWMWLFVYSKSFELNDTVFLVLHKRPVIFLHWFHHVTVLLYCWYSFATNSSSGLWFAVMNFFVHSIMYFYYFLMLFRPIRPAVSSVGPFITTIQILQMVGGLAVSLTSAREILSDRPCQVTSANWKLGTSMYLSYFFLFSVLFYAKYLGPKKTSKSGKTLVPEVCNATDSAGMFRTSSLDRAPSQAEQSRPKTE